MGGLDDLRVMFFEECEEQLAELEGGLLQIQDGSYDLDLVNAVFRAVHSIKGGAGAFELSELVDFAHKFESALDALRSDRLQMSPELLKVLLRASDVLADLVVAARDGGAVDGAICAALGAEIEAFVSNKPQAAAPAPAAPEAAPAPAEVDAAAPAEAEEDGGFMPLAFDLPGGDGPAKEDGAPPPGFVVSFRPDGALYEKANDAVMLLRELDRLGPTKTVCDRSAVPTLDAFDASASYLGWIVELETDQPATAIRDIFEFVEEDCALEIVAREAPPAPAAPSAVAPAAAGDAEAEEEEDGFAPIPLPIPAVAAPNPDAAPAAPQASPAGGGDAKQAEKPVGQHATIRVDLDRVDRLINLVGELVINQAMLTQAVFETDLSKNASVAGGLDELDQLTREIQESVMAIRAQPLKPLFQRMSRIVREVADATGKQVRLVTEGEWTEVDKTVVEKLADPLTHMIRNAIDHGVETPMERRNAGKDPVGVVKLSAAHRSGRVVIEVGDDGAGVKREKVRQRAIDRGLVASDQPLSDAEMDNLLFLPGFSTVEKVSNISGRGVGMDVVKKAIHALSGRIFLRSQPGKGSTFTMSLPLTLAVLDGMVVSVAGQTLVAPLSAILETMSLAGDKLHPLGADGYVIQDRDGFVPLVDTGAELGFAPPKRFGAEKEDGRGVALLVESEGGGRSALVVDAIQDQRQVVIKSLETNYGRVPGVAAATILGDGRVALILDVDNLVARAKADGGDTLMAAAG